MPKTSIKNKNNTNIIVIDATGRSLGRVASEVAHKLQGKHLIAFARNKAPLLQIKVINVDKIRFTGNKLENKIYYRFSGYPGGLKKSNLRQEFTKNPIRLMRKTIEHMLPKNRLNRVMINNLTISKSE